LSRPAQAGPLIDWLFGWNRQQPAYPVGQPVPVAPGYAAGYAPMATTGYPTTGYAANYGTYYNSQLPVLGPAGAGYPATMPSGIAAASAPSTLSYVPNFRSSAYRAPVTYYRPILTTDPNTGAQVVAMAPCTSYEYQTQRVPAFGRSALYGGYAPAPVYPAPQTTPTYTLPSGGIPLAYSSPAITAPYTTAYGSYGAYQNPTAGVTPYYGAPQGGSCGGYAAPTTAIPGLSAPPAPSSSIPGYSQPPAGYTQPPAGYSQPPAGYSQPPAGYTQPPTGTSQPPSYTLPPSYPGNPAPSGVYPPSNGSSYDPADLPPTLPTGPLSSNSESTPRPQLRSIVRQPMANSETTVSSPSETTIGPRQELPAMKPIPAPEGFDREPRWNPGLLREQDMTAFKPVAPGMVEIAGKSKPIHWASFESSASSAPAPEMRSGLRPITRSSIEQQQPVSIPQAWQTDAPPTSDRPTPTPRRYETSGWKTSR
jgi:hypothetical protein